MFVSLNNCREIYKNNFFNDKELPMGNKSERLVHLTLQLFSNPKGDSAYKIFFEMLNGKSIVAKDTICVQVTPAQQKLLKLIRHVEAEDYFLSLKNVHYVATYCVDADYLELWQNGYVHKLLDAIQEITQEHAINNLKTA